MKKINFLLIAFLVLSLSSCSVIGGIFKAGAAVGIIAVIVIIGIILWIISAFRGKQ
jgi:hypothetical protein